MLVEWFSIILLNQSTRILRIKLETRNIMIQGHLEKCLSLRIAFSGILRKSKETSFLSRDRSDRRFSQVRPQVRVKRTPPKIGLLSTLTLLTLVVIFVAKEIIPCAAKAEAVIGGRGPPSPDPPTSKSGVLSRTPKTESKKHQRQEGEDQQVVPLLPQMMREYFPSRGDRPPPRWAFPPPILDPDPDHPDLGIFPF